MNLYAVGRVSGGPAGPRAGGCPGSPRLTRSGTATAATTNDDRTDDDAAGTKKLHDAALPHSLGGTAALGTSSAPQPVGLPGGALFRTPSICPCPPKRVAMVSRRTITPAVLEGVLRAHHAARSIECGPPLGGLIMNMAKRPGTLTVNVCWNCCSIDEARYPRRQEAHER